MYVGASLTIGEYLLPELIGDFIKNHPEVKFSLSIGNTPMIFLEVEDNEIGIGLVESKFYNDKY